MPIIFNIKPVFAIVAMENRSEPYIMAFGAVATGSIKAKDAEIAAGIISSAGFASMETAVIPKIGIITFVTAVFDVTSVRKVIKSAGHVSFTLATPAAISKSLANANRF